MRRAWPQRPCTASASTSAPAGTPGTYRAGPAEALGRRAAARGARPGVRDAAGGAVRGRAHWQSRHRHGRAGRRAAVRAQCQRPHDAGPGYARSRARRALCPHGEDGSGASAVKALRLALRALAREWRSGELGVLLLALTVAVAALTGVGFLVSRISAAVALQASAVLAADIRPGSPAPPP